MRFLFLVILVLMSPIAWAQTNGRADFSPGELRRVLALSPPPATAIDQSNSVSRQADAASLGKSLFFDTRLSTNGRSCASCHDIRRGLKSGEQKFGQHQRIAPTLWDISTQRWFFWDGRADSLWSQATGPIENPEELNSHRLHVAQLISTDALLSNQYRAIFGTSSLDSVTRLVETIDSKRPLMTNWEALSLSQRDDVTRVFTNAAKAIAAYEETLASGQSRFDLYVRWLRGNSTEQQTHLTAKEVNGLRLFVGRGNCMLCHNGQRFSDGEFHNILLPDISGNLSNDPGRYEGVAKLQASEFGRWTKWSDLPADQKSVLQKTLPQRDPQSFGAVKTPSLRNVGLRAPYMHQGQFSTLKSVVEYYNTLSIAVTPPHHHGSLLQPLGLSEEQVSDIVAFLEALTGSCSFVESSNDQCEAKHD